MGQVLNLSRRVLLAGVCAAAFAPFVVAREISGKLPWAPDAADPPQAAAAGPWQFFTPEEGAMMEAIADRIIPPDPPGTPDPTPGGKDVGCAVYIDRQLAGPYGRSAGLYVSPPFMEGSKEQGPQSPLSPSARYRKGLGALAEHVRIGNVGKRFHELAPEAQDGLLASLQKGQLRLDGINSEALFKDFMDDTKQGFLTDPVYGGNRGMAGWRMIGYPGARYDFSDWISRHDERYPLPPVAIGGRAAWTRAASAQAASAGR